MIKKDSFLDRLRMIDYTWLNTVTKGADGMMIQHFLQNDSLVNFSVPNITTDIVIGIFG